MARRRLRHKLMLGLVLVAGSVGLLAVGTLYGIYAYYTSVKTTDRKLGEINIVNVLIETLKWPEDVQRGFEVAEFQMRMDQCQAQLVVFRQSHARNVNAGLDPDEGEMEGGLVAILDEQIKTLEHTVNQTARATKLSDQTVPLRNEKPVREAHEKARRTAENLRQR